MKHKVACFSIFKLGRKVASLSTVAEGRREERETEVNLARSGAWYRGRCPLRIVLVVEVLVRQEKQPLVEAVSNRIWGAGGTEK